MYGGIIAFRKNFDNPYYLGALSKPSPLDDAFDEACFGRLLSDAKSNLSAKAFLATEQRIPGLGNGVLQDILFRIGTLMQRKSRPFWSGFFACPAILSAADRGCEENIFCTVEDFAPLESSTSLFSELPMP